MKTILTIFRKELKDTLRDRRTIVMMIVIPLLLFPIMINVASRIMISKTLESRQRVLNVGVVWHENAYDFRDMLIDRSDVKLLEGMSVDEGRALVKSDSLHAFLVVDESFDQNVEAMASGSITFYYKGTEDNEIEKERVLDLVDDFGDHLREDRFASLDLDPVIIETVNTSQVNLATPKEMLADIVGGLLPYMFIIFCFTGSMYAAIDLAAGEKERGTLETLLTTPVNRLQILFGKLGVVTLTGVGSAMVSIFGLYLGIRGVKEIPAELLKMLLSIVEMDSVLLLLSLLLPLTIFFAAILLSLSVFAKSFKEAQSTIQPMMIVVIVPAFIGLMPGMKLTMVTSLVPILNVSLATKSIVAGTMSAAHFAGVYISLLVFALAAILLSVRIFTRESTMFR